MAAKEAYYYYKVLGVDKNASADEIKKAYRKLAIQYHPDKHINDSEADKKAAEEKFKEIAEAYDTLGDETKKAAYDNAGGRTMEGFGGAGGFSGAGGAGFDPFDIFNAFFGGRGGNAGGFGGFGDFFNGGGAQNGGKRVYRGRDIRKRINLTLEEIANGCEKEISIERDVPCQSCGGKGAKSEADIKTCPACKGSGVYKRVVNSFLGQMVQQSACQQCGGEGKIIDKPCPECHGTGLTRKKETFTVKIPAGVEDGVQLSMSGRGHAGKNNGPCGDLLLVVQQVEHKDFKREGNDLFYTKILSIPEAILGGTVDIPTLNGSVKVEVKPGTQSGETVKLRGRGLPSFNGYGTGDLYIKYVVYIPKKLSKDEKTAVEALRNSSSFAPKEGNEDKGFFEKLRDIFD